MRAFIASHFAAASRTTPTSPHNPLGIDAHPVREPQRLLTNIIVRLSLSIGFHGVLIPHHFSNDVKGTNECTKLHNLVGRVTKVVFDIS